MRLLLALLLLPNLRAAEPALADLLNRAAEEANVLQQNLPQAVSQETLVQRAVLPPSRFHPRIGASAVAAPAPRTLVREVISDYTVGTLREASAPLLVEYRQVISVDGRKVQSEEKARHALSLGIKSLDDRLRKRMLEDLAKYGLVDVATDYGLMLLEFTRRGQESLEIQQLGADRIGADPAIVLAWQQKSSATGELEFVGKQVERHPLFGRLWLRASDGVPLRVEAAAEHLEGPRRIRDQATIDYAMTSRGFLAPASVLHRHLVDGQLLTENHYTYGPFRLFAADAAIKFDIPDSPTGQR